MSTAGANITNPSRFVVRLPPPRWIGVATLALIVVAVGLKIGVPVYRHRSAIQEMERAGGKVQIRGGGPDWLRQRIGNERMTLFDEVYEVELVKKEGADAVLKELHKLPGVRRLNLALSDVSDAGLANLGILPRLETLDLHATKITDA